MARVVIPATGTVRFIVYPLDGDRLEVRKGGKDGQWVRVEHLEWSRPCVGLVFRPGITVVDGEHVWGSDPLKPTKDGDWLSTDELVVSECGLTYCVYDYLHEVLGGAHWDHASHFFEPHVAGPVTDGPASVRVVDEIAHNREVRLGRRSP